MASIIRAFIDRRFIWFEYFIYNEQLVYRKDDWCKKNLFCNMSFEDSQT